ncbi:MAG: hypothetical protein KJZ84_02430 [Bryobacteraceae bacterium]|nr:hypothetical protein [Bryobacteraceae bacterium]
MAPLLLAFVLTSPVALDRAFDRLYNFDFDQADRILASHLNAAPDDHFARCIQASSLLFRELDRLAILESEFFADDERIKDKKKLKPDPALRARLFAAVEKARAAAGAALKNNPEDADAMFSMALSLGIQTDYLALVEKRQLGSLSYAKQSQSWAARALRLNPGLHDAYLTPGISEYLMGSLPFFVRWFVRMEDVDGDKQKAIRNLNRVAADGRYLGPFARILLALIYLREKEPAASHAQLARLARDYPENPLIRKELVKAGKLLTK